MRVANRFFQDLALSKSNRCGDVNPPGMRARNTTPYGAFRSGPQVLAELDLDAILLRSSPFYLMISGGNH
jgi:hypothetical protein